MPKNQFKVKIIKIGSWSIIRIPDPASKDMPSRGLVMAKGVINNARFQEPLEPDGSGGHWLHVGNALLRSAKAKVGDEVMLAIEPLKDLCEPVVPADLKKALILNPRASNLWNEITPMARWDWIRWIRSTANQITRKKRVNRAVSMLEKGKRRPCCFDRSMCTVMAVSKGGVLVPQIS